MDSVSKCKALIKKIVTALRVEETQRSMTKDERARYIVMLGHAKTKLAKLEGSGQTVSSVRPAASRAPRGARCHN